MNIQRDDRIAIFSENRIEYAYVLFGAMLLGITVVLINNTYEIGKWFRLLVFVFIILIIILGELKHAIKLTKPKIIHHQRQ